MAVLHSAMEMEVVVVAVSTTPTTDQTLSLLISILALSRRRTWALRCHLRAGFPLPLELWDTPRGHPHLLEAATTTRTASHTLGGPSSLVINMAVTMARGTTITSPHMVSRDTISLTTDKAAVTRASIMAPVVTIDGMAVTVADIAISAKAVTAMVPGAMMDMDDTRRSELACF